MPVNLSIKNAPDEVVERLRQRAKRHHRSLQGEMLAILEDATRADGRITVEELVRRNRALGISTPDEATQWIREDRDR
ncbi:MAG TPA: Arc family DNA-binding protein [Rhizomicrobium sp.]|nr:Arc family DNA-binding protein [Rhizomicrobium sp.]